MRPHLSSSCADLGRDDMHHRLLVGFDGSAESHAAVRWASAEAERRGSTIRLLTAYSVAPHPNLSNLWALPAAKLTAASVRSQLDERLRAVVAEVQLGHPGIGIDYHVVDGSAADLLLREATSADLVVVGQRGAGAVRRVLLGTVPGALLHECPCPVVVVPAVDDARGDGVVVGVDGSPCSSAALRWACQQADRLGKRLLVVHAWEYPYHLNAARFAQGGDIAAVDAGRMLDQAVGVAGSLCKAEVVGQLVAAGAAQALLDASATAELVVVGSRGRGGWREALFGSVAHAVAAHASCPVVVVT